VTAEEDRIPRGESVQVASTRVVAIVAHAAVALDAPIHLLIHQRTQVLIAKRALVEFITAVVVTRHDGHILQMTLAALIAHGAVMRMIEHEPFDNAGAERGRLGIVDGNARAFRRRSHTGHHNLAVLVLVILELFDGALAAGAHRSQRRMPAEIRQLEAF
jgi:hypothetical protein